MLTDSGAFRIFVIGPMERRPDGRGNLSSNTQRLVSNLRSFLERSERLGESTIVEAPEALRGGADIPSEVFGRIDIADLVIADLTPRGHGQTEPSANVIYELALADALGLPTFLVRDAKAFGTAPPPIPFYFSQMQVHDIDFDDIDLLEDELGGALRECIAGGTEFATDPTANPFTSFYRAPIVNVSAAVGIAVTYYLNFVRTLAAPGGAFDIEAQRGRTFTHLLLVPPDSINRIDDVVTSIERKIADTPALGAGGKLIRDHVLASRTKFQRQAHVVGNVVIDVPRTITSLRQSPRIRRLVRGVHSPSLRGVTSSDTTRERLEAAMIHAFGNSLLALLDDDRDSERLPVTVVPATRAVEEIEQHFDAAFAGQCEDGG